MKDLKLDKNKKVYDKQDESDCFRILVDRLWPRGLNKDKAEADLWLKDIAPNNELRKWFAHDPKKWIEFKRRYFEELSGKNRLLESILNSPLRGLMEITLLALGNRFTSRFKFSAKVVDLCRKPSGVNRSSKTVSCYHSTVEMYMFKFSVLLCSVFFILQEEI